jgi:hypothetical protein
MGGVLWVAYLIGFTNRPSALIGMTYRSFPDRVWQETPHLRRVRVVTLNCGRGGILSAKETLAYSPDVILLQESPGRSLVSEFASSAFGTEGSCLDAGDAAVVAHGTLIPASGEPVSDFHSVQVRVRLKNGVELIVVSLRLEPAIVRIDLWSPDCWRSQTANRRVRREQAVQIMARVNSVDPEIPLIVGGDFNAPPGDRVFDALRPRLRDSFAEAGLGWGNTITNVGPFARIDQIWISDHWSARSVISRKTVHSDHRMVIADLVLRN